MSKRSTLVAVLSIACLASLVVVLWLAIHRPARSAPAAKIESQDSPSGENVSMQLESVEEKTTPTSRSEGAPTPAPTASSTAWYTEMQNSPLRAKMREYASVEHWEAKYTSFSDETLRAARDVIDKQIVDRVKPEMERRLSRGAYEIVSTNGAYSGPSYNTCEVNWIVSEGKMWKKVTLPQSGYEDVYKLKAESTWLYEYEQDRKALAARK